jgi:hypothetical protein
MKEAIRKTEHRRRTHEDRILRVQKELDEKLLNEIKCLICSELMEFVSFWFFLFFLQFIMFLNYFF